MVLELYTVLDECFLNLVFCVGCRVKRCPYDPESRPAHSVPQDTGLRIEIEFGSSNPVAARHSRQPPCLPWRTAGCVSDQRLCALFSTVVWVDKFCCYAYTLAVVLWPSGLVVKGKSSGPGTQKYGTGQSEERPKWGASPAKPCEPLRSNRRCSSLLGVKRRSGVPGSSFRFGDLFCSCTRRTLRGMVWAARKILMMRRVGRCVARR